MNREVQWGVVSDFKLEADTDDALLAACAILLTEHNSISHWRSTKDSELELFWTDHPEAVRLPFGISTPQELLNFIKRWLSKSATYGKQPDTDGDVKKGYQVTNKTTTWQCVGTVKAEWIIYGK